MQRGPVEAAQEFLDSIKKRLPLRAFEYDFYQLSTPEDQDETVQRICAEYRGISWEEILLGKRISERALSGEPCSAEETDHVLELFLRLFGTGKE